MPDIFNHFKFARFLVIDALDNMWSVRFRTLLSLLGIGIGAASVVALLNIGENTADEATKQFLSLGTDLIVVQNTPTLGGGRNNHFLRLDDAAALASHLDNMAVATPVSTTNVIAGIGQRSLGSLVIGASDEFFKVARLVIARGRFLSEEESRSTVVVVGGSLAKTLSGAKDDIEPGDMIRLDSYLFTVVGVLQNTVRNPLLPFDIDNAFIVPIYTDRKFASSTGNISNILMRVSQGHDPLAALDKTNRYFQAKGLSVEAQGALQLIEGMKKQSQLFTWMLGGIAFISLLVGGVGVMNALLAGIIERKREIGLRLALGANRVNILSMVISESIFLSLLGGGIGTFSGVVISGIFSFFSGWDVNISFTALAVGFGMSVAMGLFFGIYPSLRASRLSPIEALRYD